MASPPLRPPPHQSQAPEILSALQLSLLPEHDWALIFLVVSVIAGIFGFTGISAATAGIAKVLFFIAIAVFLIFLVLALVGGALVL